MSTLGHLSIVGTGPGDVNLLAPLAAETLRQSTHIIGYREYFSLIDSLIDVQTCIHSELGQEVQRAQQAIDLAANGHRVSLISSGDPGVYAMASVLFELLCKYGPAHLEVEVIPGISAMQIAAARVGAPLGHDFCTISLSTLLTPWEIIARRIDAAGLGDFNIAIYNPLSKQRQWQLPAARDILLNYRQAETPVVIAKNLTRDNESIHITTLGELSGDNVDMFSLILVGSSRTQRHGRWVYTPRGYDTNLRREAS